MYIEIRVQWTIHKMDCKFKYCDIYQIIQELTYYKNNVHHRKTKPYPMTITWQSHISWYGEFNKISHAGTYQVHDCH